MPKNQQNEIVELQIESIAFQGSSIAKRDSMVYFVKGGVPGDIVSAEVYRKKAKYREARILEIIEPSVSRIKAECGYFGICGGCSWQNIIYEEQLKWKYIHVRDSFDRIGKIENYQSIQTLAAEEIFYYRNKMEFSFGSSRWLTLDEIESDMEITNRDFALGLHIPGRFDKILDIDKCLIQQDTGNLILNMIKSKSVSLSLSAFHERKHEGFLRNLVIRVSKFSNEMMVILITTTPVSEDEKTFVNWFINSISIPEITINLIHAINDTYSPVAVGEISSINGIPYLIEDILGIKFKISPFSFFQTNSGQLNIFIQKIIEFADLRTSDIIWDLYCGTGSISLPASGLVKKVFGFELSESSTNDAIANMKLNKIDNCEFRCLDLHAKNIYSTLQQYEQPDTIILDPPRSGCHGNLIDSLLKIKPSRIVYVSCNPATQARDLAILQEEYQIVKAQPVDMFPQTYHIENIAQLIRK